MAAVLPPALVLRAWLPVADDLDVPYWDQWEMVPLLETAKGGTLAPGHFWTQDVEARPVLPRLVLLALALVTDWDTRAEVALNLAVSAATLAVLVGLLRLTVHAWSPALVPWLALATSAVTFSLARYEAWVWGPSLATVTSAAWASLAMWGLAWRGRRGAGPWLAMLCAVAAAFSFTNGLVLLVLVPLGLLLDPRPTAGPFERRAPIAAAVISAIVVTAYFAGFATPASSVAGALAHPGAVTGFLLVYLGAPLGALSPLASAVVGATGLAGGAGAGGWLWTRRPGRRAAVLPWLLLGAFGVLAGGMAAAGRFRFGVEHALASRYQTFSGLYWIAVVVVSALAIREVAASVTRRRAVIVSGVGAVACLAAIAYVQTWTASWPPFRFRVEALRRGRECVVFHAVSPETCLALIYPDPDIARRRSRRLEALASGPFRPRARQTALATYPVSDERRPVGSVDSVQLGPALLVNPVSAAYHAREVIVSGRATDPGTGRPARGVLVTVDGQVAGRTRPDDDRWTFRFGAFRLEPGPHSIEAYAVLDDGRIARLARGWSITVAPPKPAATSPPPS